MEAANLGANGGIVEDSAGAPLPVIDQAFADLPNGALDKLGVGPAAGKDAQ